METFTLAPGQMAAGVICSVGCPATVTFVLTEATQPVEADVAVTA